MLLKDHDMSEEGKALLDRTGSFDEARLDDPYADPQALAASSPRASLHTLSAPPQYYPPLPPSPAPLRLFTYPPSSPARPIQSSAHVSHTTDKHLTMSAILDLNATMPPLIPYPQAHLTSTRKKESVNGLFVAERGRVDLKLGFVGKREEAVVLEREAEGGSSSAAGARQQQQLAKVSRERIKVYVQSHDKMKVECLSRSPPTLPISLRLETTTSSSLTLVLPPSFRGPVHLHSCSRATLILSPAVQHSYTHISSEPPLSFVGDMAGWSGASPTEEENAASAAGKGPSALGGWLSGASPVEEAEASGLDGPRLDELWIDVSGRGTKIAISFAGEGEEEEMSPRAADRRRGGGGEDGSKADEEDGHGAQGTGWWDALVLCFGGQETFDDGLHRQSGGLYGRRRRGREEDVWTKLGSRWTKVSNRMQQRFGPDS